MRTFADCTARRALKEVSKATPVQQQNHLVSGTQFGTHSLVQDLRPRHRSTLGDLRFGAQVHQLYQWQLLSLDPVRQGHQVQTITGRPGLQRRRGTPQHDSCALDAGSPQGYITRVITGRLTILVARVVFLVNDNRGQCLHRRENGRSGSHGDTPSPRRECTPSIGALRI
jgi:hypothetical protein